MENTNVNVYSPLSVSTSQVPRRASYLFACAEKRLAVERQKTAVKKISSHLFFIFPPD
jgi:hypothetical protein